MNKRNYQRELEGTIEKLVEAGQLNAKSTVLIVFSAGGALTAMLPAW